MKKKICYFVILLVLSVNYSYSQIDTKSYIPNEICRGLLFNLSLNGCGCMDWERECDQDIIKKAQSFKKVFAIKDLSCVFRTIDSNEITFDRDISNYIIPDTYFYSFFKENEGGYDEEIFGITTYFGIGDKIKLICYKTLEDDWNELKKGLIKKGWDYNDIYIYSIMFTDFGKFIVEYKGNSYLWKNDKLIPAMEYIKKHYTLKQFRRMFTAKLR